MVTKEASFDGGLNEIVSGIPEPILILGGRGITLSSFPDRILFFLITGGLELVPEETNSLLLGAHLGEEAIPGFLKTLLEVMKENSFLPLVWPNWFLHCPLPLA